MVPWPNRWDSCRCLLDCWRWTLLGHRLAELVRHRLLLPRWYVWVQVLNLKVVFISRFYLMKLALEHLLTTLRLWCSLLLLVKSMLILWVSLSFLLLLLLLLYLRLLLLLIFNKIAQLRCGCILTCTTLCTHSRICLLEVVLLLLLLLRWDNLLSSGNFCEKFIKRGLCRVWMHMVSSSCSHHMGELFRLINHRHRFIFIIYLQNVILIKIIELWLDWLSL